MYLRLNHQSGEPIYRQIVEQVKFKVASGQLKAGDLLPSIREMAKELKINPRTVVKAYEVLQAENLVVRRQGQGVFIAESQTALPVKVRKKAIADLVSRLLAEASRMGASGEEVQAILKEVWEGMRKKQ